MDEESRAGRREEALQAGLRAFGTVVIGYSGGVDSTYLAAIALETLGPDRVLAVTGLSPSVSLAQRTTAAEIAAELGLPHRVVDTYELDDPRYAANPSNRCFFCKSELWTRLREVADEFGGAVLLDGSNADDRGDWRPGFRAAEEHGVRSPLLESGLTKRDIRLLSRRRGLRTWDQPAAPCLSSRIPYGLAVTPARLKAIEGAESALRALGFVEFRVRHHGDAARLEIAPAEMDRALERAAVVHAAVRDAGFQRVLLDVRGYRSGSLNEGLPLVQLSAQ